MVTNSITEIVTRLKNSNNDKTQELKLRQNSTSQIMMYSKTQIVTKLKYWNIDKTQKI